MSLPDLFITFLIFFTRPETTEIYTLSLHDALPIFRPDANGLVRWAGNLKQYQFGVNGTDPKNIQLFLADRKSTRLNSSHVSISYAVFCLKKKKKPKVKLNVHTHLKHLQTSIT